MESYNFLLFPIGNKNDLTDSGWEIIGSNSVSFDKVKDVLLSKEFIKQASPDFLWSFASPECYFEFNDGNSIIEIQLNGGKLQKEIKEISVRLSLCNPDGTYKKTLILLKDISKKLNLNVLDMRLSKILDFNDDESLEESDATFNDKKMTLFKTFNLPDGTISEPLRCGKDTMNKIRAAVALSKNNS